VSRKWPLAASGTIGAFLLAALPAPSSWAGGKVLAVPERREVLLTLPEGGLRMILLARDSRLRTLEYQGRTIRFFSWKEGKRTVRAGIVGVDFSQSPGVVPLVFRGDGLSERLSLRVRSRSFQVSRLHVARSFVTPPESFLARLARERKIILGALHPPDGPFRFHEPFILPLSGRLTHDFGAYRYLNGRPMARHSGEDIDAPQGTPVRAANEGVVRLAGPFYYDGNMVIIDHGGGLLTEYLHMSDLRVRAGEPVHRGEVIGHVGHSGRVTGPVLHYGAVLFGNHVNPMLLTGLLEKPLLLPEESAKGTGP